MAYQTYITEALVCGSRTSNTSDRSYLLFAREAGMLYATAKSVREERSKQRFALQEFSLVRATLIHGKAGWRVAGVEPLENAYMGAATREARTLVRNVIVTLRRVVRGETAHESLFDDVVAVLRDPNVVSPKKLELTLTLRLLEKLGYVAPDPEYGAVLGAATAHDALLHLTEEMEQKCQKAIEHGLMQSQL